MDGILNKTRFAMKRYTKKLKTEKKKIQLNKKTVQQEWKKNKKSIKYKQIE